jgi:AcrR family transcriptional regulator
VTRLIVYRIFESKQALYRAVLDDVVGAIVEEFDDASAPFGAAERVMRAGRRHPDGFRLLWRHAAHEAMFAGYATMFRDLATDYTQALVGSLLADDVSARWAARSVVAHLYDGVCAWLDDGVPERDAELVALLGASTRAMVTAWAAQPVARASASTTRSI